MIVDTRLSEFKFNNKKNITCQSNQLIYRQELTRSYRRRTRVEVMRNEIKYNDAIQQACVKTDFATKCLNYTK